MTEPGRRTFLRTTFGLLALVTTGAGSVIAQNLGRGMRTLEGTVLNPDGSPCANAIVYLQDLKSREMKTYITPSNGKYRFTQLNMDTDYQVWAKHQNAKSKTRSISSFSSKPNFIFDLKLEPSK